MGAENASLELLEGYAGALERAGRSREAVSAYEAIRRRDARRTDVATRIESLKRDIGAAQGAETPAAHAEPTKSRYEVLGEIGRGGMGVVYKARDRRLGRIVALKRLPDNLRDHPSAVALFEREARAAAALNHVNIVTLFDAGEENGSPTSSRWSCSKDARSTRSSRAPRPAQRPRRGAHRHPDRHPGCTTHTSSASCTATSRPPTCSSRGTRS